MKPVALGAATLKNSQKPRGRKSVSWSLPLSDEISARIGLSIQAICIRHQPPDPPYAVYEFVVALKPPHAPVTLTAWRRWSECAAFAARLGEQHLLLPPFPSSPADVFSRLFGNALEAVHLETRRENLERHFRQLLASPTLLLRVLDFLGAPAAPCMSRRSPRVAAAEARLLQLAPAPEDGGSDSDSDSGGGSNDDTGSSDGSGDSGAGDTSGGDVRPRGEERGAASSAAHPALLRVPGASKPARGLSARPPNSAALAADNDTGGGGGATATTALTPPSTTGTGPVRGAARRRAAAVSALQSAARQRLELRFEQQQVQAL